MYTAKIENASGEVLTLTGVESEFQVVSITGLNPPQAQLNLTDIAGMDGAKFNSSKLQTRNIVITLKINNEVERNRQILYLFFRTKEKCVFYFTNQNRNVNIVGYVENVECDLFSDAELMQISIICPYPYFQSINQIIEDISNEQAAFYFPFSIDIDEPIPISTYTENRTANVINNSESESGAIIQINVLENVSKIEIRNTDNGDDFTLNYSFEAGDQIIINTNKGQKSVRLIRGGLSTNIFSAVAQGSVFFQLGIGDNHFSYLVDDGADDEFIFITFKFANQFRGV